MEEDRRIGCGNSKLKLEADRRLNKLSTESINIRSSKIFERYAWAIILYDCSGSICFAWHDYMCMCAGYYLTIVSLTPYEALIALSKREPRLFNPPSSAVTIRLGISNSTTGTFFSAFPSSASIKLA